MSPWGSAHLSEAQLPRDYLERTQRPKATHAGIDRRAAHPRVGSSPHTRGTLAHHPCWLIPPMFSGGITGGTGANRCLSRARRSQRGTRRATRARQFLRLIMRSRRHEGTTGTPGKSLFLARKQPRDQRGKWGSSPRGDAQRPQASSPGRRSPWMAVLNARRHHRRDRDPKVDPCLRSA